MTKNRGKTLQTFRPVILVYCEGETEKEYLSCLKKDKYANLHIELKQRI